MSADNNTPLGFSSYNNFDPSSFQDNPSLFEDSPYVRKLLDSTLSFDTKMAIAKQANLGKLAQLNGYRMGYILGADDEGAGVDPDSGLVQDAETGDTFRFRMKGASGNFDAVDNADVVAKSRNKRSYQPDYIAQITGKRVEDLTEFDFKNVKNYQTQEAFAAWKDPNHQFMPYNPDFVYAAPSAKQKIPVLYKSTGSGFYGRDLTDMINPATGRSMTFDAAANPYLNASFMLGDYEDNPRNRKRFEEFNALKAEAMKDRVSIGANTNEDALQDARDLAQIEHYKDNTNILEQAYDKFAYAGQLAKHSFVSEFTKFISSDRAKKMGSESVFDVKGWQALDKQLSREDQLSSRGAIFRQLNKEADKFYDNMQNEWGKGNYFASAKNALGFLADYVGMMPELIGQSAGQTGVGIAIGTAVGSAVAPGAGTVGGAMIGLAASVLGQSAYTALSNSLETLENYKKANNGKEMPWDETLQMFGEYLAAASYEAGLDRVFLGRLFGRSKLGQKMFGKPSKILEGKNSLQAGALAGLGEFPQEGWESTIDAYYSQKEGEGRQSRLELATSPEVVKQAVGGAVAGFGMGAGLTGLSKLGTGKASKLFRQRVEATQKANDTQTYTGVDADLDESHTFIAGLNSTTLDDKLHNLQQAVITPESAHARAENIRKQLNNPKSLLSRTAYDAGTIEANQWDLAAAQYYKDKGWSNDQIEKELGRSLKDIFGSVVHGSNLNTNKLYEQGLQLNEAQHAIEEETYTKIGKNLGLDEKFIRNTIEQTNNDARYGGSGYYTYRDRILDRLDRLRTESLTPESKAQYEDDIENNLTAMLRLYGDQARKIMTMTEGAEHLAATNDRQYETSWKFHDKGFVLHRTDLANNTYDADRGAYAIYRNALQDLKEIEKSFNSLLNAGLSKETEAKVRAWLGENDTNNPRAIPDWGIASTLEQRFKAAGLSLNQKAKNESKFKDKPFTTDDLVHSLTYISRVDPEQDKSAKYNQEFQNLHYAINQSPEVVQQLKDTVNSWKNKTAKEKALAALDKVVSFRDTVNTNEEIRVKNHDPVVKDVTAQLDTIEKEYPNVYLEPGVDTSDTRQQKLMAQTKRYNALMDLRNKLQSVIDNNNKDDLALRERLNNTVKELRKNMASLASGKQNQATGEQGKFAAAKEFLKNFTASIKRRVDKAGLERELKKLQKKYDDSITKGHSKEIVDRIQSQITVVQDRLAELNKPAEQSKPKPKPNTTDLSSSEENEIIAKIDEVKAKEIKESTDIDNLQGLKQKYEKESTIPENYDKLTKEQKQDIANANAMVNLVNARLSELNPSVQTKPTNTSFNKKYHYGTYNSLRQDPTFVSLVSAIINDKVFNTGKLSFSSISYFLSDEFQEKLNNKNLSKDEITTLRKDILHLAHGIGSLMQTLQKGVSKDHLSKILAKVTKDVLPKLEKEYAKQTRLAYQEAKKELSQSTVWRLINGDFGKISYDSLVHYSDKEQANELRKKLPKLIVKEGGSSLDLIASNTDNDIGQASTAFDNDPSKVVEMLYETVITNELTLDSEARKLALQRMEGEREKINNFSKNATQILTNHLKRLSEAIDDRIKQMVVYYSENKQVKFKQKDTGKTLTLEYRQWSFDTPVNVEIVKVTDQHTTYIKGLKNIEHDSAQDWSYYGYWIDENTLFLYTGKHPKKNNKNPLYNKRDKYLVKSNLPFTLGSYPSLKKVIIGYETDQDAAFAKELAEHCNETISEYYKGQTHRKSNQLSRDVTKQEQAFIDKIYSYRPENKRNGAIYYAGIGSRETPADVLDVLGKVADTLDFTTLRSGRADGADTAFERGTLGYRELYEPENIDNNDFGNAKQAIEIARAIHPTPQYLTDGSWKLNLQARNSYQVLGKDLKTPSDFIICYAQYRTKTTRNGYKYQTRGGTGQAIRLALSKGIPVVNLADNPKLLKALQNAKSREETLDLISRAVEAARRFDLTKENPRTVDKYGLYIDDALNLREDGSGSTGRGGDGNSSTTPSGSDSTASQAPNSGNAQNTPSGASQSDQNGQGVQTPTSTSQGSQNGSQTPSQGSQAMSPEEFAKAYPEEIHTGILKALQQLYAEQRIAIGDANFASYIDRFIDRKYRDIITDNFEQSIVPFVESQGYFKYNEALTDEVKHESMYDVNLEAIEKINNLDKAPWIIKNNPQTTSTVNQGTTEDEEADFIPASDMDNISYSTISDDEMAEARRLFSKGKSKIIPNVYPKEMILDITKNKMDDTSKEGVSYLLSENRSLGDIEERVGTKQVDSAGRDITVFKEEKTHIILRNQIKESNRDAECLLAYDYKLYSEQSSFDPNRKNIEIFREAADKVKFDPSQTTNPKGTYYHLVNSVSPRNKDGSIDYRESKIRKSPAMLLLYDTVLEFDKNGHLTNNPQFNFNDFVLTMADFSLREYLTNNDYERFFDGKYLDRTDLAKLFGENEDTLTAQDETDLREIVQGRYEEQPDGTVVQVREGGIPRSVMINGMGELMLRNMGIVENKESSNYGFFSSLTTSLGAWMLDYGEQLGLYHLGEVETRKGGILKAPKIAVVSVNENNLKAIKRTQTAFKGTITIPEDGSKPIRDNNGLNLFKNANSSLGNDPVWDGSNIKYTDKPVYVKNSGNLTEVSQFRKEVMETMANVVYSFDTDITDFLDEEIEDGKTGWDLLAKTMGYTDFNEFKYLSVDEQESVKGQNAAIEKQIDALRNGVKKQKQFIKQGFFKGIKFKQFWSKNGRIFIDSPNMNPQTMKLLRFTCLAEGMRYTYDPTLAKTDPIKFRELIQQENFAIAQAFDALGTAETTDKFSNAMKALSVEELKTLRKLLVSNSTKEFKNKIKELGKTNEHFANLEGIGVESVPQALNAITHLIRRREANGKAFTTSLVAENDSTTSGYVIKLLQFPMIEQMGGLDAFKELLEKVGVTLADGTLGDKNLLSIHELKKMKGFLDLYRTTAMAVSDYIEELQQEENKDKRITTFAKALGMDTNDSEDDSYEQDRGVLFLCHTFLQFKDALPKKDLEGKISGAFRELMKPATMVFGYSAGIESISRKLSETVMKDYIKVYTVLNLKYKGNIDNYIANEKPDHTKEEIEAIQKGMNAISRQYVPFNNGPKTFLEALQKFSYNKIVLTIGKNTDTPRAMSLDECFMHLIGDTYGQKAGEALEAIFEPYVKINNLMIEMSNTATDLYKRVYDSKVKELLKSAKEENREVSSTEMQKLKDELKELQPYLDLADDGYQIEQNGEIITNTSNMALTKFERDQGENNLGANYYIRDGKMIDGSFTYGNERTPGYPVRAGAVIPIHCLDGAIMADVLSQYGKNGLTGIHDAIVMSAFQSNEISRYYNQRLFQRCKDYNIFQNMVDNFDRVCRVFSGKKYRHLIPNTNGNINDMLVANGKGKDQYVAKDFYTDPNTMERKAIPKTIYDLLKGYTLKRKTGNKKFIGVRDLVKQVNEARENFYKMSFVIANLDSSGIQGSFLSQEDGELVSQWNSNLRHANDKYNEDVTKTRTSLEAQEFLIDESEFFAQAFGKSKLTDSEKASQVSSANNQEYVRGSGPRGYQTNGAIKNTYSKALESAEARVEALTDIQNLAKANGNRVCSDEQIARLQLLAGSIAPERVRGVALDVAENGRWSAGEYNSLTKHIQVVMDDKSAKNFLDPKTQLCAFSLLAPAEIYVHELLHAANDFAFAHRGVFGFNSQIRKLLVLQDEARKILTWEDFMPEAGTFDESVRKYYEQNAKEFYDYIFKEADPKTLDSLNEFCSFVATNENLRKKLQKVTINQPTLASKANLVDRVIAVLKNIYDVIFGRKKFSEAFMRSYKVLKGDSTGKTTSLLDEFDRLHRQLHTATYKAMNPLLYHPLKIYETFLDITDSAIKTGNEKIHKALEGIFKYHDIRWEKAQEKIKQAQLKAKIARQNGDTKAEQEAKDEEREAIKEGAKHMPKYSLGTNVTKTDIIKLLGKLSKQVLTNGEARKQMRLALKELTKVSQQSVWMSTYRDFMGPDQGTATFEALGMKLRLVDKISKNQEATAMRVLQDSFGRPVTDYENTAIANSMLYTDLQCFYDGSNLSDVKELLRDTSVRKNLIQNTLAMFKQKLSARDYSWLQYSATSTAFNMVHGIGNPLLNLNAQGIAEGKGWDHSLNLSDKEIESLDKLITLYALENTSQEYLDITASLPEAGLEQFLKMHQEFVNESKNGYKDVLDNGFIDNKPFIEATSVMKGYVKTLTDPSIDSIIAIPDPNDVNEFKKQGYDDKMVIPADGIVNTKDTHVYTRFGIPNRRDGNVVSVQGHQAMGKTIMQFAFSIEDDINSVRKNPLDEAAKKANSLKRWKAMRKKADDQLVAIRNEVINCSKQGKEFTFDDINKLINKYSSFSPIYDDKNAGPRDYRQTLARDIKRKHLGLDERGLTILSRMFGSVARQVYGKAVNEQLLQFTIDYMQDNMTFMGNYDKDGHKFIKIEKDSPNKYLRDSWKVVPPNFKEYVKHHDLYIREDWLQDYFGVPNYTLLDNEKIKKHTGYFIKRAIAIAEMVMKTIAYARKQAIVLKIPGVLVGNIISNLMFSIMNHRNPVKVIKTTIANAQAIRDYIENRKVLDRILFKTRLGTVTKAETEQIPSLRRKLENNIVKPLMEKGMYQSIIEDMQSDELESIGKVNKWIKHNKILQKIPASLKTTFRTVFMMEGTPAYDFMFIATQYSDFVARCTEYQLSMDEVPAEYEKAKKDGTTKETFKQFNQRREQEISTMITNAFINYDKPQSQLEQYLNDLGLIMFSKFGKRIQSVIKNQMYRRPIHSILFLMSQLTFVDTEDILEQNMFNKKWLNLVHSPVENFIGAVVPMPLQILLGDQKAF